VEQGPSFFKNFVDVVVVVVEATHILLGPDPVNYP
jgi:hypothetical protein